MTVDQAAALSPLPDAEPFGLLDGAPDTSLWPLLYRHLVRGRRFNEQATALTRQGRLAVYPSSAGQEACQVAAALALGPRDWLFPSYRDTLAAVTRGVEPVATPGTPQSTKRCTTFSPRIVFFETWPSQEYDRRGDIATCNRLTPMLAQQIKEELNSFKMVSFRIYKQAVLAHSPRGIWWYGGMVVC